MPYLPSILRPLFERAETALLRHGTEPRTILFLAVFSVLDGFLPLLPAEVFVLSLCILQPKKGKLIVLVFAAASAWSAFLLALALGTLTTSAETLSQQLLGAQGPQALAIVRSWGPVSMVFFSIFPDSPRSSIALLALSGVAPASIGGMVFIGKLMLYASLLALIHHLPARVGRWRGAGPFWQRWLQGRASRFVAYCRRIRWLARHPEQRFSIAKGIS
jgi:membrane protein YqaA with SNARE-associated domain